MSDSNAHRSTPPPPGPAEGSGAELTADTALFEQMVEGIAILSRDGRFLYVNPALERLCGQRRGELLGRTAWEALLLEEGSPFRDVFRRLLETGAPQQYEGFHVPLRRWFANRLYLVGDRVWAHVNDVTEVKRLQLADQESRLRAEAERARLETLAQELRESEERYRNFVRQSADGIWCFEPSTPIPLDTPEDTQLEAFFREARLTECNDAMARQYGFEKGSDMLGVRLEQLLPREDPRNTEYLRAFIRAGYRLEDVESHEVDREGRPKVFLNSLQGAIESGYLMRAWGIQRDITENKVAERALRESEERFRNMADHAPVMLWVTDAEGRCTYLNRQWYAFTGQAEVTGLESGWLRAVHPEDSATASEAFHSANTHRGPFRVEYRMRRKDGEYRWAIDSATPRFGVDGEFLGYIGSVIDISERKQVEEQRARLLRVAQFLSAASATLSSSLDPETTLATVARLGVPELADWCLVDLVRRDGTFQRVEVATAFPEDEELAREARRFGLAPAGNPQHPPTQALLRGQSVLIEQFTPEHALRGGHDEEHARVMLAARPVSLVSVPLVARGNIVGVMTFFTSRSGRRYGPAELTLAEELGRRVALSVDNARLYQEAQEAIRVRDEFLSVASHELKTPLTPISLRLQALARESEKQPDAPYVRKVRDSVEAGRKQVHKLSSLIGDLLDVSRIAAGRLKLELESVDCAAVVREVATRYEAPATQARCELRVEVPEQVVGWWDRLRLDQVVTNLVDNAIKYGAGRPIHLRLGADEQRATLTVRDEGIGIEPRMMTRIFERFERAVSERHYGGLGLGLYITKTLVEAMGGSIQVQSQPGQGATFTVELPRSPPTP